jgi:hypothetical protein
MNRLRIPSLTLLLGMIFVLSGCLYDNPPSGPSRNIDTWLVGQWDTKDKSGKDYHAVVTPSSPSHYRITIAQGHKVLGDYDAWISTVEGFPILVAKSLSGESTGKHALLHTELLTPAPPPPGGIGATRIRLSELQLDPSAETLDSYHLRRDIRDALKVGTLLSSYDVAADRKKGGIMISGSVIWTKSGGVALDGETF